MNLNDRQEWSDFVAVLVYELRDDQPHQVVSRTCVDLFLLVRRLHHYYERLCSDEQFVNGSGYSMVEDLETEIENEVSILDVRMKIVFQRDPRGRPALLTCPSGVEVSIPL